MLVLLLALVLNVAQCAETIKKELFIGCESLPVLAVVPVSDLDELWKTSDRKCYGAQEKWSSMRDFLINRLKKKFQDQAEVNRNILLSHFFYAMILDKRYEFSPSEPYEGPWKVSNLPHDLAVYKFATFSDGRSSTDLFQKEALPNFYDPDLRKRIECSDLDLLHLFSWNVMKQLSFVSQRPNKQEYLFAMRQSVKLIYVDSSIESFDMRVESVIKQMIVTPLQDLSPSFPSVQEIQEGLKRLQYPWMREKLVCAYLLSLFFFNYNRERDLNLDSHWEFWITICGSTWQDKIANCAHHPHLLKTGFAHKSVHQYEHKDLDKILHIASENLGDVSHDGEPILDLILKHRYGFPILQAIHPQFVWTLTVMPNITDIT
ncbi:MAG: hypothetical protein OXC30_00955 [Alphaproteobacteria bacterium]|nr:hypothetical protein [Alphaproteobacteria bacterium]